MRDADSTASLEDYKLAPPLIMMGDTSGTLTLTATDDDVEGDEVLNTERHGGWRPTGEVSTRAARRPARAQCRASGRRPSTGPSRAVQRLDPWRHAASPSPFGGNGAGLASAWRNAASNAGRQSG